MGFGPESLPDPWADALGLAVLRLVARTSNNVDQILRHIDLASLQTCVCLAAWVQAGPTQVPPDRAAILKLRWPQMVWRSRLATLDNIRPIPSMGGNMSMYHEGVVVY